MLHVVSWNRRNTDGHLAGYDFCINKCLFYGLVLSLLIVVSLSLSAVASSDALLKPTVKTAVFVGQAVV